ncbi:MAG TPA: hypothetical protein VI818_05920 [Candidatus Thermoplasmatota archaeon]|nr:hypothetical protein [Candidatus Thermoplasmatota archaeon]
MNRSALLSIALLATMVSAGCGGKPAASTDGAEPSTPAPAASPDPAAPLRAIPIKSIYNEAPTGQGGSCGLTFAAGCEEYITEHVIFTGTLKGQAMGVEHSHVDAAMAPRVPFEKDPFIFVGSVADCGTGMLAFHVSGWFYPGPAGLHVNETLALIPGTQSTGLASVVDVKIYLDTPMGSGGLVIPVAGTVWCR